MGTILFIFIAFIVLVVLAMTLKIVRQHEKGVVESFGRYSSTRTSGLNILIPFYQSMKLVDMREQVMDVPPQEVITKDNVSVIVDCVIYFQITDPFKVTYNVAQFHLAVINLGQTTLRNIIGELELDESLTSRDGINTKLRSVLDDATDKWGVKVTRVELKAIEPPRDITDAMSKQMKAEREKRASILEAEGIKLSEILKADGQKQSEILKAEGERQSAILNAEGEAIAIESIAEAKKYEITTVYDAIHKANPTNQLIALKYLESLEKMSDGQATKIFLPFESSSILSSIGGIKEIFDKS